MQTTFKICLTLFALVVAFGCNEVNRHEEADEKAIRNIVHSYEEAYNQENAEKLAADFASDATYNNPLTGESAEGKEAIEKLFKEKFADSRKRHLEIVIKDIQFPSSDEAIEKGVMKIKIDDRPEMHIAYQAEYAKENNKWVVKALNEIELESPIKNDSEHLNELSWFIGKWSDTDDNVEILSDNQWDKFKNFITQNFKMKVYGQDDFEGKQIIAWDPEKQVIRSWVFDSDGEFGEGTWEKVDNSWYATMRYILSDGRIATSKNIYTPIDGKSYTFSSVEREVDGEVLPDMNPVTVEKVE